MRWTVSVPVWGDWHVKTYINRVLWRHVLMGLDDCHYIIHTDAWGQINDCPAMKRLRKFCEVEYRPAPTGMVGHERMAECHRDAMSGAEAILFLMPDCVNSVDTFDFVKASKKKLVVLGSVRTLSEPTDEIPLYGNYMADWSVTHMHPTWRGLIWGSPAGSAMQPTNIFFKSESGFWLHGFHLHPIAAVLEGRKSEGTVDGAFVESFSRDDTFVVTDREIAQLEITNPEKDKGSNSWDISNPSAIANFMRGKATPMHQYFFRQRIMLSGSYNGENHNIPTAILEHLNNV